MGRFAGCSIGRAFCPSRGNAGIIAGQVARDSALPGNKGQLAKQAGRNEDYFEAESGAQGGWVRT